MQCPTTIQVAYNEIVDSCESQMEPRSIRSKTMVANYCESHEHSEAAKAVL